jgi:hypothetical protein
LKSGAGGPFLEIAAKKAPFRQRRRPAVIDTMLILMRTHGVPTLSRHDGLVVPKSKADVLQVPSGLIEKIAAPTALQVKSAMPR